MKKSNLILSAVVVGTMLLSAIVLAAPPLSLSGIRLPQIFNSAYAATVTYDFVTETLPNGQPAYRLDGSPTATIPGPTLIVEEGDVVTINGVDDDFSVMDQTDTDGSPSIYTFTASTPGTYVYKDESSALIGLFGAVIVNAASGDAGSYVDGKSGSVTAVDLNELDKEFVMFMVGSTFWGSEINGGSESPLWTNPTISAVQGDLVRFHILSVGPGHTFHLHAHRWVDPGTTNIIDTKLMDEEQVGEDSHVFIVAAGDQVGSGHWQYHCHVFAHMEAGMHGIFNVVETGPAISEAGASPYNIHPVLADILGVDPPSGPGLVTFEITDEPGSWFKNTLDISGVTLTKSLALANPGDSVNFVMSQTGTVHTITSLLWPTGAEHMPMDEVQSYKGGGIVPLTEPGLYVFTCKIHPYMFGGVIVDDPDTQIDPTPLGEGVLSLLGTEVSSGGSMLLDLGETISLVNGATIPTGSDLALRLTKTFFVATTPSNWRDYNEESWNPSYPAVSVKANVVGIGDVAVINLDTLLNVYFSEGSENELVNPSDAYGITGVGEVWVDTQFEETEGKNKPGTATAVDTTTWEVSKKVALPDYNMNNPHNMWTDRDQTVIYQTEWFSNKLSTFDRETGEPISQIVVGEAPSHVMTRVNNDKIHVALNGEEGVVEIEATTAPSQSDIDQIIPMQGYGQNPTHPHAHWMSSTGDKMVTPNSFTHDSTLYDFNTGIINKQPTGVLAIATGMTPDDNYYVVANLLSSTISVMDMNTGDKVRDLELLADYNPIPLDGITGSVASDVDGDGNIIVAALPIQTPISPDGKYMVTANTLTGNILITDVSDPDPDNWFFVKTLPCEAGCHGVQFGAKAGGGYLAYVSGKFANDLIVIDIDDSSPSNLEIVGKVLLTSDSGMTTDTPTPKEVTGNDGMGGQGVLPVPVAYNGWVQNIPQSVLDDNSWELSCEQRNPISPESCIP